jgi:hypothetical protein
LTIKTSPTYWCRIYISGPQAVAEHVIRKSCLEEGLCVTIEPTKFIYTGGEETGVVVGLINYPRFPSDPIQIRKRAESLACVLLDQLHQHSVLIMDPTETRWITKRTES